MVRSSLAAMLLVIAGCTRPMAATTASTASSALAPSSEELRALLSAQRSHRFDDAARARGCPAEQSLGEYLDLLVRNTTSDEDGGVHRLTMSCGEGAPSRVTPMDPPASDAHWRCVVDAYAVDPEGESPWHYELRLRVRKSDRRIDLDNLSCPGAS